LLNSLKKIFQKNTKNDLDIFNQDLTILCGLMIEAANTDGKVEQVEINKISSILINTFHENPLEVETVLSQCLTELNEPKSLHYFTSKINKSFSSEKKLLLLETLWEIILEDGEMHDFESNLIRRLAGLLYISDVSCGNAKTKALSKFNRKQGIIL
jgi:uncharacterized tellurite resistance protein B-like protein